MRMQNLNHIFTQASFHQIQINSAELFFQESAGVMKMLLFLWDNLRTVMIIFSEYLKMSDKAQINLRPRKPYQYLPPDVSSLCSIDLRPRPHRIPPTSLQQGILPVIQDSVSPAMEMNSNAKILVKFLNSTNKALRQFLKKNDYENYPGLSLEHSTIDKNVGKIKNKNEQSRKIGAKKTIFEEDIKLQNKQPYNIRDQNRYAEAHKVNHKIEKFKPKQQSLARGLQSAIFPQLDEYATLYNQSKLSLDPQTINKFLGPISQNHLELSSKAFLQQRALINDHHLFQARNQNMKASQLAQTIKQSSSLQRENKLFGRSAYHVAIAYHIHLKKIKSTGQEIINSNSLDPTYTARRLKGEKIKNGNGDSQ